MFDGPISSLARNLEALRDFSKTVSALLEEKRANEYKGLDLPGVASILMALYKLNPEHFPIESEKLAELSAALGPDVNVDVEKNSTGESVVKVTARGGAGQEITRNVSVDVSCNRSQ